MASSYLSRENSEHLLMVGTGGLAPNLVKAHCAVRPISRVSIWGRSKEKSQKLAHELSENGLHVNAISDLHQASEQADIICTATLSKEALIFGKHIKSGTHVDLVGAFKPSMREADDQLIKSASVFVDTIEGALQEAGDIIQAIQSATISAEQIKSDLLGLIQQRHPGRISQEEITVFKSVGTALEDLAAATLVYKHTKEKLSRT